MAAERKPGDFGTRLKEARERRGISLRQIANATKISVSALEALERNAISRLPGGIFSRSFVRSYAIEVGLDPEATIQDFIAQFPDDSVTAGHPTSEQHEDNGAHESNQRTANAFVRLIGISVPIVGAVLYFGGAGRPAPDTTPPVAPETSLALPSPPPSASPEAATPALPPAVPVKPPAPPRTAPAKPPAAAAVPPASEPARAPADTPVESRPPPAPTAGPITVSLVATAPCWVSAIVDGERLVAREFQAGERVTFDVQRDVVLTAGDAAALEVTLNGAGARRLGNAGQAVTVRMTTANFKEYLALQ